MMEHFFGGSPAMVLLRLAIISLIVGVLLAALGLDAFDVLESLKQLLTKIYDLGFGAFEWVLRYFLLGAVIVFPIWAIARLIKVVTKSEKT